MRSKELSFQYQKPVALCYFTDEEESAYVKRTIDYPIFTEPSEALGAWLFPGALSKTKHSKRTPFSYPIERARAKFLLQKARGEKRDLLLPEAFEVLQAYGIPVADYRVVDRKEDLIKAMGQIEGPLALKSSLQDLT